MRLCQSQLQTPFIISYLQRTFSNCTKATQMVERNSNVQQPILTTVVTSLQTIRSMHLNIIKEVIFIVAVQLTTKYPSAHLNFTVRNKKHHKSHLTTDLKHPVIRTKHKHKAPRAYYVSLDHCCTCHCWWYQNHCFDERGTVLIYFISAEIARLLL